MAGVEPDKTSMYCSLEEAVYCLPVEINPPVTIPSVFLKSARQSLLPPGRRKIDNQRLLFPNSRLRKYSFRLKIIGSRAKLLAIILTIFVIASVSLITSVIFMYCNQYQGISHQLEQTLQVESYKTSIIEGSLKRISAYHPSRDENRSPCVGTCWTYSAFRFRSQCISGYCQCDGEFYNPQTCLPDVYGCKIESNSTEAVAFFDETPQTVYTCSPTNQKDTRNHVISTYGHHNSDTVNVNIRTKSLKKHPITLILANYYPTKWRLNISKGVQISKIVLVSNDHVRYSSVEFQDRSSLQVDPSRIRKASVPVGYGDDRNGAHTVDLLKYIVRQLGPLASFSGAHYADHWTVTLDRHDSGVKYNNLI